MLDIDGIGCCCFVYFMESQQSWKSENKMTFFASATERKIEKFP